MLSHRLVAIIARTVLVTVAGAGASRASAEITVRTVDGGRFVAQSASFDGGAALKFTGATDAAHAQIALTDLVAVEFAAPDAPLADQWEVVLVDGSRLVGTLAATSEDELALTTTTNGLLRLSLDVVATAARTGGAVRDAAPSDLDRVVRRGGADAVRGTVTAIGASGVAIDGDLGAVTLKLDDVERVVIAHPDGSEVQTPAHPVAVVLKSGAELRADLLGQDGTQVRIKTVFANDFAIAIKDLVALRFASKRAEYLSDLTPKSVEQTPYFGGPDDFLFPWQRDQSVTGRPLIVGGRQFSKGLGLHRGSRLTYALDAHYERFEATVGISDEVLLQEAKGSIIVRVLVDGQEKWASPLLHGGDAALEVPPVALAGARELTIEVDFGDGGDFGDRAVIGDALLLKKAQ